MKNIAFLLIINFILFHYNVISSSPLPLSYDIAGDGTNNNNNNNSFIPPPPPLNDQQPIDNAAAAALSSMPMLALALAPQQQEKRRRFARGIFGKIFGKKTGGSAGPMNARFRERSVDLKEKFRRNSAPAVLGDNHIHFRDNQLEFERKGSIGGMSPAIRYRGGNKLGAAMNSWRQHRHYNPNTDDKIPQSRRNRFGDRRGMVAKALIERDMTPEELYDMDIARAANSRWAQKEARREEENRLLAMPHVPLPEYNPDKPYYKTGWLALRKYELNQFKQTVADKLKLKPRVDTPDSPDILTLTKLKK